ncbi:unnamed protein product [Lampetra planeri]
MFLLVQLLTEEPALEGSSQASRLERASERDRERQKAVSFGLTVSGRLGRMHLARAHSGTGYGEEEGNGHEEEEVVQVVQRGAKRYASGSIPIMMGAIGDVVCHAAVLSLNGRSRGVNDE